MKIRFIYGPKNDLEEHVSREVGAALIAGGFALEIGAPSTDPVDAVRKMHPAFGWVIQRSGTYGQKILLVRHDGVGGKMFYEDVPAPVRRWKYDPATGNEGYVLEPSDCPEELAAEFRRLKAASNIDPEAVAERRRIAIDRQQMEQDDQNKMVGAFIYQGKNL